MLAEQRLWSDVEPVESGSEADRAKGSVVLSLEAALSGCTSLRTWNFRVTFSAVPFLTLEDHNAKIKGSRDPLDVQPD